MNYYLDVLSALFAGLIMFACATTTHADGCASPPSDRSRKTPLLLPVAKSHTVASVMATLTKNMPVGTVVVPLVEDHAVLAYVTPTELAAIHKLLGDAIGASPQKPSLKPFAFGLKDAKWDNVLDLYAKASGLTPVFKVRPTGKLTINKPTFMKFTLGDITDAINEKLKHENLVLIQGERSFTIVKSNAKFDPQYVAPLDFHTLPTRGRMDVVEVAIPLQAIDESAQDLVDELKKYLTHSGEIIVAKGRWLIIRDRVENIHRIRQLLSLNFPCPSRK